MLIGVISDTHGLLRPEAVAALQGVKHIIHAGDVGDPDILDELHNVAPVTAVRGNIDRDAWAQHLPLTEVVGLGGVYLYVLHDLKQLDLEPRAAGFAAVISGHTHHAISELRNGVLYLNPGSAGPRRFRLPITVAHLNICKGTITAEIVPLVIS